MSDDQAAAAASAPPRKPWYRKLTLSIAGFTLSVTLALINLFYAVRGSDIAVQPPAQLILYRDGDGAKGVLTLAVRLAMVNADASHGDVLMKAALSPAPGAPRFDFLSTVKPVFTSAPDAASRCDIAARCVAHPGLLMIEQEDQILDIPGGAVRGSYLTFPIVGWNCTAKAATACARYANFDAAADGLAGRPLDVTIRLDFFSDGHRDLRCVTKPLDAAYLAQKGWSTLRCREASVKGGPLL